LQTRGRENGTTRKSEQRVGKKQTIKNLKFMKTKILFIAVAILCSSLGIASAEKEKKVYSYGWAYSHKHKIIYVSCMVSGIENSPTLVSPLYNVLQYQWMKRVNPIIEDNGYYVSDFTQDVFRFLDYDYIDDNRTEWIRKFRNDGFSVRYIDDFYYRQKEKE
jgi:hypothetical protein